MTLILIQFSVIYDSDKLYGVPLNSIAFPLKGAPNLIRNLLLSELLSNFLKKAAWMLAIESDGMRKRKHIYCNITIFLFLRKLKLVECCPLL